MGNGYQRGKGIRQVRDHHLVEMLRDGHAFQVTLPQVAQVDFLRPVAVQQLSRGRREQDLSPVRCGTDARHAVDGVTHGVIAGIQHPFDDLRRAGVQAHAHRQGAGRTPGLVPQAALGFQCSFQGVLGRLEGDLEFVAQDLEHQAVVVLCGGIQDVVVARQGSLHGGGITFPYGNVAHHIREQEGDRASG